MTTVGGFPASHALTPTLGFDLEPIRSTIVEYPEYPQGQTSKHNAERLQVYENRTGQTVPYPHHKQSECACQFANRALPCHSHNEPHISTIAVTSGPQRLSFWDPENTTLSSPAQVDLSANWPMHYNHHMLSLFSRNLGGTGGIMR